MCSFVHVLGEEGGLLGFALLREVLLSDREDVTRLTITDGPATEDCGFGPSNARSAASLRRATELSRHERLVGR